MRKQLDKLMTGLAGEYAVAAIMNLNGWVASLSLKNYPGVDIFGMNPKNNKTSNIQVKTSISTHFYAGVKHSDKLEDIIKGPYVFVYTRGKTLDSMSFYVLTKHQLISLIRESDNKYYSGPHKKEIKDDYSILLYIGRDNLGQYENKWENLGLVD